ncbi:hypothetical protein WR25_24356 [Diploscapter pachys]|uniref:PhnB-like domain-containing protein n=1 Tax=Diploscapter pachys TaxID=2018661 RepID=A0A2A2K075_9BILA|nr:hypothetical protein WR25_24356 [Diploscapter pachys]
MTAKNTVCLWYDNDAEDAANFYASTFPDSRVTAVHKAPADYPSGKAGDVITVEFTPQRGVFVPGGDRQPGRDRPLLERHRRQWWQ